MHRGARMPRSPSHFISGCVLCIILIAYLSLTLQKVNRWSEDPAPTEAKVLPSSELPGEGSGRHIPEQSAASLATQLKPFASQRFWIIAETGGTAPDSEQVKFGQQLRSALRSAGWIESEFMLQRHGAAGFQTTKMEPYSRGGDKGVLILTDRTSLRAGSKLNAALSALSLESELQTDANLKNAILILVGDQ